MSKYTAMDINSILEKHAAWLYGGGKSGKRADLRGADLRGADLRSADLRGANLRNANFVGAHLRNANLRGANLSNASLRGADLRSANFVGAILWNANLWGANLGFANLWGADLWGANLGFTDLWGADLRSANLDGCNGNMVHIKAVFCGKYAVTYTVDVMQIGCQRHPIANWWEFDEERILEMDGKAALKWWRAWKPILKQIIETAPAEATGYKGE